MFQHIVEARFALLLAVSVIMLVIILLCTERGVEYECKVSAKNAIDFGTPAVATIRTPEGGIDVRVN